MLKDGEKNVERENNVERDAMGVGAGRERGEGEKLRETIVDIEENSDKESK